VNYFRLFNKYEELVSHLDYAVGGSLWAPQVTEWVYDEWASELLAYFNECDM